MRILALASLALVVQHPTGCNQPDVPTAKNNPPYQRFVPVSAQAGMMGVPWTGYFALDTKTGQLCLTSDKHEPENIGDLPTCVVVTMTNP
jgi:hypothetical protein